ncbi:hypothetical protein J7S27_01680 [Carnobacteriaceae bacterium zg-C25]|nr:hypothetical protein J7S27_01680 [Carnobacteriaceae bacterium zg-C25]
MATKKNLKWETKNNKQPKKYGSKMRKTDYDIPSFGYKSAFLMVLVFMAAFVGVPAACQALNIAPGWPTVILGGPICGFSVAYLQIVREKKEKMTQQFWIVGGVLSIIISLAVYALFFHSIMI